MIIREHLDAHPKNHGVSVAVYFPQKLLDRACRESSSTAALVLSALLANTEYREMPPSSRSDYSTTPTPSRFLVRLAAAQPTHEDLLELLADLDTAVGYCTTPPRVSFSADILEVVHTSFWVDAQGRHALSHTELQALAVRACEEAVCTRPNIGTRFMVQREADKWFARRRPLAHWAVNVLISHDLTTSILLQCDDAITLSRLARVCRGWAAPELQLGLDATWRALVVSRWASGAQPLFSELTWKRRYQLLSQTLAQNVPQPSPTCKSLRVSRERSALAQLEDTYTFSCIACDAVTGLVLFCVYLEPDQRAPWPGEGGFQLVSSTEVDPVLPAAFSRQDVALTSTQTCPAGQIRIKILVLRGSDLKVTQLAEFELDMSSYGGSDYGGGDPGQDPTLFYDHDPILIPPLWCPDLEERKHTRIYTEMWAGPAEGAEGSVVADAGAAAPPQQPLSWRLHRMDLMFMWGHGGATAEKLAAVRTAEQGGIGDGNSSSISCTEVLAVLGTWSEWV